jgi:hypothetical protein
MALYEIRPVPHEARDYCMAVRLEARNRAAARGDNATADFLETRGIEIATNDDRHDDERDTRVRAAKIMGSI